MDIVSVTNDIKVDTNDFGRMGALLDIAIGELSYYPDIGIDTISWLTDSTEYNTEQFDKFLLSELSRYEFNVLFLKSELKDKVLEVHVRFQNSLEVQTHAL